MSYEFIGNNVLKVPSTLFTDPYCGGVGGVFNMFSLNAMRYFRGHFVGYIDGKWTTTESFDQQSTAFVYNRRLGRLIIPTPRLVLSRSGSDNFSLTCTYIGDGNELSNSEAILNNDLNRMYFNCGQNTGGSFGYTYKIVFTSGGAQNMTRDCSGGIKRDNCGDGSIVDKYQLGLSQGAVDDLAEMYIKAVTSDSETNPVNTEQDIYLANCSADYDTILYKLNSPLIARSADRNNWFLSLNQLDWQKEKYDQSKGLNNLKVFFGRYPALFICNPTNGVCGQKLLSQDAEFNPSIQFSQDGCSQKCIKPVTKYYCDPTKPENCILNPHQDCTLNDTNCFTQDKCGDICKAPAPSTNGWAYRNGECKQVSDCKPGECSKTKEECIKKNTPKISPTKKSYMIVWIILLSLVIGGIIAYFLLRKRRRK